MAITDVDGRMRRINQSWLDLFGYPADDCIGQGLIMVLQPGATPSVDWMRAGFTPNGNGSAPGHLGLTAVRERAQIAGGLWKLESHPGAGTSTSVAFWLPAVPDLTLPSPQALPAPA